MIPKGSWVQIKKTILQANERAEHLPEETKKVPLIMWTKGFLLEDASINEEVKIKTITGRIESGILICQNPAYLHTYGEFVPEILEIDRIVHQVLDGGDDLE